MWAKDTIAQLRARVEKFESLNQWALRYIEIGVAIQHGKFHDQPSLEEDIQKMIDDGYMPNGYYEIKKLLHPTTPTPEAG